MDMNWENLVVISTEGNTPGEHNWRPSNDIFPAETCARHIYFGLHEDFFDCAKKSGANISAVTADEKTTLYQGRDAIIFLTAFCAGLGSHYQIDEKLSGQINGKWTVFGENHPKSHARLKPYIDKIFADAALVKKCILIPHLQRPTYTNSAIKIAELSRDSKTLLIVEDETMSKKMLMALGHGRHNTPDRIAIAHPYGTTPARAILTAAMQVGISQKHNRITAQLTVQPFEQVMDGSHSKRITTIFNAEATILCNNYSDKFVAEKIVNAWKSRTKRAEEQKGKLIQLTKAEDEIISNPSDSVWNKLTSSDNYYPFTIIKAITQQHTQRVNQILQMAHEAIEYIAGLRMEGDRVKDIVVNPNMALKYTLATRPMGSSQSPPAPSQRQRTRPSHAAPG